MITKKKPTITSLKKELSALRKNNNDMVKALENTTSGEMFLREELIKLRKNHDIVVSKLNDEITRLKEYSLELASSYNDLNVEATKTGNTLSETKMWYGKAQQTIIDLNEEIVKLKDSVDNHKNKYSQGVFISYEHLKHRVKRNDCTPPVLSDIIIQIDDGIMTRDAIKNNTYVLYDHYLKYTEYVAKNKLKFWKKKLLLSEFVKQLKGK